MDENVKPAVRDAFTVLLDEHDKIMLDSLLGNPVDFSNLRCIASDFEQINSDGTDEELWKSTCKYLRNLAEQP
jgi:hypothetical protein